MPSTLRSLPPVPTEIHHSNGMGDESDDDKLEYWKSDWHENEKDRKKRCMATCFFFLRFASPTPVMVCV